MESFARHIYNVKRQHKELSFLKDNLKKGSIIVQEDFAENYTLKQQNEVMAAHWAPDQVTVFTGVVFYRSNDELQHMSYAVVSDQLEHDKQSVYAFNKKIIKDVKQKLAKDVVLQHIHHWTDGCGAQFKNKYTLSNLPHHQEDFSCSADWNFFETAHGKGPVDGIGGVVKRSVWRCTMQGRDVPNDAQSFYEIAKREAKSVIILYVGSDEIAITAKACRLEERWASCKTIPGTHKFHQFQPSKDNSILLTSVNSSYQHEINHAAVDVSGEMLDGQSTSEVDVQSTVSGLKVANSSSRGDISCVSGDYIAVEFVSKKSNRIFVGQINEVKKDGDDIEFKVLFMRKRDQEGYIFGYPDSVDASWINSNQVISKLGQPLMHGRGQFKFLETIQCTD